MTPEVKCPDCHEPGELTPEGRYLCNTKDCHTFVFDKPDHGNEKEV